MATRISMSVEEYEGLSDEYGGVCLACGNHQYGGVEPDAEGYECESCGEPKVCGVEQALIMGRLSITDGDDDMDGDYPD